MSKFLITGGAGFIGGNFCHYMVNEYPNDEFVCIDALTYAGNLETLQPIMNKPNFKFVYGNICNQDLVFKLFEDEKFDYVVNFAAESHVDRSIENPRIFLETNILGTQTLMDACRKYGIKRYHQVSTDEVYGDLPLDRPDLFFTEDRPLHTSSPYSASKASADLLVQAYHRTFGLPITISRCSNNYGPYHFPEKLIPLIIKKALADEPLPVYGNGANVRDWLHVYDHCTAIDLIVRNGRDGEVYNVGGHNERTNLEVVKTILKELGKPESLITYVKDRAGHDLRYAMDSTKLMNELGWEPKYTFETGIGQTINWYKNNVNWINNAVFENKLYIKLNNHVLLKKSRIIKSKALIDFDTLKPVSDEHRGYLVYDNVERIWKYVTNQLSIACDNTSCNNLIILLESPHRSEYEKGVPIGPAKGKTGKNIELFLADKINELIINGELSLDNNINYNIYLVNAIQYQTSAYNFLKDYSWYNHSWHCVRDNVFKLLWNETSLNLQDNLKERIKNINGNSIIINCVTGGKNKNGLKKLVDRTITCNASLLHPSSWKPKK